MVNTCMSLLGGGNELTPFDVQAMEVPPLAQLKVTLAVAEYAQAQDGPSASTTPQAVTRILADRMRDDRHHTRSQPRGEHRDCTADMSDVPPGQ